MSFEPIRSAESITISTMKLAGRGAVAKLRTLEGVDGQPAIGPHGILVRSTLFLASKP